MALHDGQCSKRESSTLGRSAGVGVVFDVCSLGVEFCLGQWGERPRRVGQYQHSAPYQRPQRRPCSAHLLASPFAMTGKFRRASFVAQGRTSHASASKSLTRGLVYFQHHPTVSMVRDYARAAFAVSARYSVGCALSQRIICVGMD